MKYALSLTIVLTALAVGGCGSKGEKLAQEVCDCIAAKKLLTVVCLGKAEKYRNELKNDRKETAKFQEKMLACVGEMTE